jgi:carbon monoxide dehydrogenase subunit G
MPTMTRTFTVDAPADRIVDYLKDFAHAEEWDPGTEKCTRNDSGPIAVGASWHNVSKIAGISTELTYTLAKLTADTVEFVGKNDTATSTDTITVTPHEGGSELTYRAVIEMHGVAKIAEPAAKLVFEKVANDTEKQLTKVLEQLA